MRHFLICLILIMGYPLFAQKNFTVEVEREPLEEIESLDELLTLALVQGQSGNVVWVYKNRMMNSGFRVINSQPCYVEIFTPDLKFQKRCKNEWVLDGKRNPRFTWVHLGPVDVSLVGAALSRDASTWQIFAAKIDEQSGQLAPQSQICTLPASSMNSEMVFRYSPDSSHILIQETPVVEGKAGSNFAVLDRSLRFLWSASYPLAGLDLNSKLLIEKPSIDNSGNVWTVAYQKSKKKTWTAEIWKSSNGKSSPEKYALPFPPGLMPQQAIFTPTPDGKGFLCIGTYVDLKNPNPGRKWLKLIDDYAQGFYYLNIDASTGPTGVPKIQPLQKNTLLFFEATENVRKKNLPLGISRLRIREILFDAQGQPWVITEPWESLLSQSSPILSAEALSPVITALGHSGNKEWIVPKRVLRYEERVMYGATKGGPTEGKGLFSNTQLATGYYRITVGNQWGFFYNHCDENLNTPIKTSENIVKLYAVYDYGKNVLFRKHRPSSAVINILNPETGDLEIHVLYPIDKNSGYLDPRFCLQLTKDTWAIPAIYDRRLGLVKVTVKD